MFKGKVHCVQCVKLLKREGLTIVLTELKITQDKHRLSDSWSHGEICSSYLWSSSLVTILCALMKSGWLTVIGSSESVDLFVPKGSKIFQTFWVLNDLCRPTTRICWKEFLGSISVLTSLLASLPSFSFSWNGHQSNGHGQQWSSFGIFLSPC